MGYIKEAFYPTDIKHAMDICITPNTNNPRKYEKETHHTIKIMEDTDIVWYDCDVADFGCGVGRISHGIIERFGCKVTGFDISEPMLMFASEYVNSKKFFPTHYSLEFDTDAYYEKFDLVVCLFVLQHSEHPIEDIDFIHKILKQDGKLLFINEHNRLVPSGVDEKNMIMWKDDGLDVHGQISKRFSLISSHSYPNRFDNKLTIWQKIQ